MGNWIEDLRVGNWVTISGVPTQITRKLLSMLLMVEGEGKVDILPIDASMGLLLALGFKEELWDGGYVFISLPELPEKKETGDRICYYESEGQFFVANQYNPYFYGCNASIKYLHDIQNLYYSLSKVELPINADVLTTLTAL